MKYQLNDANFSKWFAQNIKKKAAELSRNAKNMKCYLCGKNVTSYKNSHSIPQFILENLSEKGDYSNFSSLIGESKLKSTTGKNDAGTFHLLCEECENKSLKYEQRESYVDLKVPFAQPLLYEIAQKNMLYLINKANEECSVSAAALHVIKDVESTIPKEIVPCLDAIKDEAKNQFCIAAERIHSYEKELEYIKYCFQRKAKAFKVALQIELSHRVPIAIQLAIPVAKGVSGETINDFRVIKTNTGESIIMQYYLHVCVFPLDNRSLVLLFCHEADKNYNKFIADISNLDVEEQTKIINYMLFQYAEDYFCNKDTIVKISNNKELEKLCKLSCQCDLSNSRNIDIPNLLSSEYKL